MNKQFTFRGMEHSNTIEEYANKHLEKIERFLEHEKEPVSMHIIFTATPVHKHHEVEFQVTGPSYTLNAHRFGPEFYDLISAVMDCMFRLLTEAKRRRVDERKTSGYKRVIE